MSKTPAQQLKAYYELIRQLKAMPKDAMFHGTPIGKLTHNAATVIQTLLKANG